MCTPEFGTIEAWLDRRPACLFNCGRGKQERLSSDLWDVLAGIAPVCTNVTAPLKKEAKPAILEALFEPDSGDPDCLHYAEDTWLL
jgi:hypothetical protein